MNCKHCGNPVEENGVCAVCGTQAVVNPAELPRPENVVMGIIGALIGALIGGASIVLLSQLGYIASISGFVTAICALKGYELLGKQLSKKGIVICIILLIITPFAASYIDLAILVTKEFAGFGVTFGEALSLMPELMSDGTIIMSEYLKNLGMIYLFVALGAYSTIKNAFASKK